MNNKGTHNCTLLMADVTDLEPLKSTKLAVSHRKPVDPSKSEGAKEAVKVQETKERRSEGKGPDEIVNYQEEAPIRNQTSMAQSATNDILLHSQGGYIGRKRRRKEKENKGSNEGHQEYLNKGGIKDFCNG